MKQILQSLKDGETEVADVPAPKGRAGHLLIGTTRTLVSVGTERMLVDFGHAGLIGKARQQPDKVRMVLDKMKTDGVMPTLEAVRGKLDQPLPLGYCNVGRVLQVGAGVSGFAPGNRVASNGKHAEVVCVPRNLCAKIPDDVSDDEAAFTVIGAIALQGIRLVAPQLGENVVVTGLGLIGLITVQLLVAQGCNVLGLDFDPEKLELAERFGARSVHAGKGDAVAAAQAFSNGQGVDAVIITASTKSSEPVHEAALMCRKRGRIVLVGVTGLNLSRADFYEKELTFQVSCSYGPGRYDPEYEDKGHDYPIGYVRWTEQRNFEAVLAMMAAGKLDVKPLISHRFGIGDARSAYEIVGGSEPSLGIVLDYPGMDGGERQEALLTRSVPLNTKIPAAGRAPSVSFIGTGNYATGVLIPAFAAAGARLATAVSGGGASAVHAGRKFGFARAASDAAAVMQEDGTDAVVITTRHDSHARMVLAALEAGKHVFVEKPLCLTLEELEAIEAAHARKAETGAAPLLMTGFNRRFSPLISRMKELLEAAPAPRAFVMTVNAGAIPPEHWTQDREVGGGRIVGEACHFIDLLRHLAGAPIAGWSKAAMEAPAGDTVNLNLTFADGSIGTVHYFANGSKQFPKERLEVFSGGAILQMDNFRLLRGFGWPGFKRMKLARQDKGQKACARAFVTALEKGGEAPIPLEEIIEASRVSILLEENAS